MFGMSAERNEVERPARIDSGGTPPHLSISNDRAGVPPVSVRGAGTHRRYCLNGKSIHNAWIGFRRQQYGEWNYPTPPGSVFS